MKIETADNLLKNLLKPKLGRCRACGWKTNNWAYWCFFCSVLLHQTRNIPEQTEISKLWLERK